MKNRSKKNKNFVIKKDRLFNSLNNLNNDIDKVHEIIDIIYENIENNGKILLCGNGGSAADAQHLSAEFLVRLRPNINRKPIPAISLAMDTSTITACGNDYSFNKLFSRNLEALSNSNDILIVISTSGNSKNILNVLKTAKRLKIFSIGLLGNKGGKAKKYCDKSIIVKSPNTATIQECHIFLGHYIFEQVEKKLLKNKFI
ncbi:SIS domain-containing protein [Pelagibacterales bacterium SAG-MED06]|nr:SIS domain-containing protein [Pelagibacterales bacterium SAG-MED06]